jgi:pilus assembly protein CpaE
MAEAAKIRSESRESVRLLACLADEVTREAASRAAAQLGWAEAVVRPGGVAVATGAVDRNKPPQLLLVDLADATEPAQMVAQLMSRCGPATRVIAIGTVNDVTLFRQLSAEGVSDYLVKPVSSDVLCDAFRRALSDSNESIETKSRSKLYAFLGTRGGVGTTTLALSTAWLLAHDHKLKTAVVDLDLHFGNLALSLDLEPGRGLRQALERPERTDGLLLASAMVKATEQLPILSAEEPLEDMLRFDPAAATAVLAALGQDYETLVVDIPRSLDGASRQVLSAADSIVIVTDLSLSALRDALRIADLAKSLGSRVSPIYVGSQIGALQRGEIGRAEFERGLGTPLEFVVPFDAKAARTTAQAAKAFPVAASGSKATAEFRRIAARLVGGEPKSKAARGGLGGLRKWFG